MVTVVGDPTMPPKGLKGIMKYQIKEAAPKSITATSITESFKNVAKGKSQFVFASVEEALDEDVITLLKPCKSKLLHKYVAAIIIDEDIYLTCVAIL